jgi:acyl carrier protein
MMTIEETIHQLIRRIRPVFLPIGPQTNLYEDLGFDSLAFIKLILSVENEFSFTLAITEMEQCLVVGRLADLVREKTAASEETGGCSAT